MCCIIVVDISIVNRNGNQTLDADSDIVSGVVDIVAFIMYVLAQEIAFFWGGWGGGTAVF
jgi:hypothetical protein